MKSPRIVVLRGKPTAGKSTAFQNLRKDKRMKDFIFVDHAEIKAKLENLPDDERREQGKKELFSALKQAMLTGKDILVEETSVETLNKYVGKEIKKQDYKIIVFQFEISLEIAHKRNIQRAKQGWHKLMSKEELESLHKRHVETFDKNAILIDTSDMNPKEVVEFIIKKLVN